MAVAGTTIVQDVELDIKTCPVCFITYGVPSQMMRQIDERGGNWYCPTGHRLHFIETELDKTRKLLEAEKRYATGLMADLDQKAAALKASRNSHRATKGVLTKTRKRIGKGVCPSCNRHFVNVERHMESQHPDLATTSA